MKEGKQNNIKHNSAIAIVYKGTDRKRQINVHTYYNKETKYRLLNKCFKKYWDDLWVYRKLT